MAVATIAHTGRIFQGYDYDKTGFSDLARDMPLLNIND
jgi:hypothetical protein